MLPEFTDRSLSFQAGDSAIPISTLYAQRQDDLRKCVDQIVHLRWIEEKQRVYHSQSSSTNLSAIMCSYYYYYYYYY